MVIPAKQWSLPRGVTGAGWIPGFPELGEGCLLLQQHWDLYFRSLNVDFWGCFPSKSIPWKPSTEHPTRCGCSEPNSESQTPNPSPQGLNGNFQVVFFCLHLPPVLVQLLLLLCPHGKATLPFGASSNSNISVEFISSFNLNSLPQPPACEVEIILLPYLVSLINVVEHSDSDKQLRKAQRK